MDPQMSKQRCSEFQKFHQVPARVVSRVDVKGDVVANKHLLHWQVLPKYQFQHLLLRAKLHAKHLCQRVPKALEEPKLKVVTRREMETKHQGLRPWR
jgi:hypothetical protein